MLTKLRFTLTAALTLTFFSLLLVPTAWGDLLVTSGNTTTDSQVLRYSDAGALLGTFIAPGNGLLAPRDMLFGADNNLYVVSNNSSVLRYNGMTGAFIDTFVPVGSGGLTLPTNLTFRPDGLLYVSSFGEQGFATGAILRYNAVTGAFVDAFVAPGSGGLVNPTSLLFTPEGNLLVATVNDGSGNTGNEKVLRYNGTTGAFIDAFVPPGGTPLIPRGLILGPGGDLLVSDEQGNRVLRYSGTNGSFVGTFASGGSLSAPRKLLSGPDGSLYVASTGSNSVLRYDGTTGAFLSVAASGSGLTTPRTFVFTPAPTQNVVPEPGTCVLLATGLFPLVGVMARRRNAPLKRL